MAEPTVTTASGVSLTVLFIALLGPMAGPYVLIALSAVAGAMWPLSAARTESRIAGAWLLLRCTATALVLTSVVAGIVERTWGLPISEGLAPVALIIGAMGNGWRPIFQALGVIVQTWAGEGGAQVILVLTVMHVCMCLYLFCSVFVRAVFMSREVVHADVRLVFWLLGVAALWGVAVPVVIDGWSPDIYSLLITGVFCGVQHVTGRYWQHKVPEEFCRPGHRPRCRRATDMEAAQ